MWVRAVGFGLAALVMAAPVAAQEVRQGNSPPPRGGSAPARNATPATPAMPSSASLPLVSDSRFELAMSAIQTNNPERALDLVRPLLANFEQRYSGEKRQIYCAVNSVQSLAYMAEAAAAKREAVAIEPAWCRAQYIRAFALVDLKRLDEAQEAYQRLVGYAPQNSRYLNELGYVFQQKKQWQQSADMYRRSDAAAGLSPENEDMERCVALRGIGYDLVELSKFDEAEASYRKCLAIAPDDAKSLKEINYIREQRKNLV
jgi:tetratricopeptide (TPR) repeat protein